MMARNNAVAASCQSHDEVEAAIRELRRFCLDLQKLAIAGCDGRTDEIARNQEINNNTPEPWVVGMHSECRTPSRQ